MRKAIFILIILILSQFNILAQRYGVTQVTIGDAILSGRLFIIGVGINDYPHTPLRNCIKDTRMMVEHISELYKSHPKCNEELNNFESSIFINELYDAQATNENIKKAFENFALKARPNDYFFFIFNGMSDLKILDESENSVKQTVMLFWNSELPLSTLSRWIELIPCNDQMIITEAGHGKNYGFELIASLSPKEYAYIVDNPRNRIIVTTSGLGVDAFNCNGLWIDHGPLNWIMNQSNNIFNAFYSGVYGKKKDSLCKQNKLCDTCYLEYDLIGKELECNINPVFNPNAPYVKIFYEKEFLAILSNYLQDSRSRGVKTLYVAPPEKTEPDVSENYAVVIGINEYEGKETWKNLSNPLNDAVAVADILEKQFGYKTIRLDNAEKNDVLNELLRMKSLMNEQDNFLLFVAGHGYYDEEFSDGFIVTKDSRALDDDPLKDSYLDFASLQKLIDNMPANNIFVIFDICFGGTFGITSRDLDYIDYSEELADISIEELEKRKLEKGYKSRIYLASGEKEVPDYWNNSLNHSPFADKLIKILSSEQSYYTPGYIHQKLELNITEPLLKEFGNHDTRGEFFMIHVQAE